MLQLLKIKMEIYDIETKESADALNKLIKEKGIKEEDINSFYLQQQELVEKTFKFITDESLKILNDRVGSNDVKEIEGSMVLWFESMFGNLAINCLTKMVLMNEEDEDEFLKKIVESTKQSIKKTKKEIEENGKETTNR